MFFVYMKVVKSCKWPICFLGIFSLGFCVYILYIYNNGKLFRLFRLVIVNGFWFSYKKILQLVLVLYAKVLNEIIKEFSQFSCVLYKHVFWWTSHVKDFLIFLDVIFFFCWESCNVWDIYIYYNILPSDVKEEATSIWL